MSPTQVVPPSPPPDLPPQGTERQRTHLDPRPRTCGGGGSGGARGLCDCLAREGLGPARRRGKRLGDVDELDLCLLSDDRDGRREDLGNLEVEDEGLAEPGTQAAEEGGTGPQSWTVLVCIVA